MLNSSTCRCQGAVVLTELAAHLRAGGASLVIASASSLSHPASIVSWYWQWVIVVFSSIFALMHMLQWSTGFVVGWTH